MGSPDTVAADEGHLAEPRRTTPPFVVGAALVALGPIVWVVLVVTIWSSAFVVDPGTQCLHGVGGGLAGTSELECNDELVGEWLPEVSVAWAVVWISFGAWAAARYRRSYREVAEQPSRGRAEQASAGCGSAR